MGLQAAAWAATERAKDQEACGCDEVRGTQVTYDDARGEVIVLDDSDDEGSVAAAEMGRAGPSTSGRRPAAVADEIGGARRGVTDTGGGKARRGVGSRGGAVIVDLTLSDDEGNMEPAKGVTARGLQHGGRRNKGRETVSPWEWACPACTYKNAPWAPACDMCSTPRVY
jgi:hypothetical protein